MLTSDGDAFGWDVGTALEFDIPLSRTFSVVVAPGISAYFSEDIWYWGPNLNFGLNISW